MRRPRFMGNSIFGLRLLQPAADVPKHPVYGTRRVSVEDQYADEVRLPGQPRFTWNGNPRNKQVQPAYAGDQEKVDGYVMVARDDLLKREIDPEAIKGAQITGYTRNGTWCPEHFEVIDVVPTGHLPRVGPILVQLRFRNLKDLTGAA
jgi:hypothetical protein